MSDRNQEMPRLMEVPDDGTIAKPEELDGEDITILDAISTIFPDGREAAKWVVRRASGERKIYWAAGQNPTLQVRDWFRNYANRPLHCRISRYPNQRGTLVWRIQQREPAEGEEMGARQVMRSGPRDGAAAREDYVEEKLAEVGL